MNGENEHHLAEWPEDQLLAQCEMQRTKRGGPGGQHRNKTESAIVIRHSASGVQVEASERRSQHDNRRVAIRRLRLELARRVRSQRTSGPSEKWTRRVKNQKLHLSQEHDEYPALLAELWDQLVANELNPSSTAKVLGISTSQVIKFLKADPDSWKLVNEERQKQGQTRLR